MIQHCVFLNLKQDVNLRQAENILLEISGFTDQILGFEKLGFGQNLDFENKSSQYSFGFIATFADQKALSRYAEDPLHIAIGSKLEKSAQAALTASSFLTCARETFANAR